MEDKISGERKKLSLSSGKLTLKNSISTNKSPNSYAANPRNNRGTVQVEVTVQLTHKSRTDATRRQLRDGGEHPRSRARPREDAVPTAQRLA